MTKARMNSRGETGLRPFPSKGAPRLGWLINITWEGFPMEE